MVIVNNSPGKIFSERKFLKKKQFIILFLVMFSAITGFAQTFEDYGNAVEQWDILDWKGDAKIYPVTDHTCPPGYGPDVLHIEGGLVMGMAKNQKLTEGTFVVLYRENEARDKDADGVLLVMTEYDQDISIAHNTKEKRPHVWFEQDNDCGVQLRLFNSEEKEENLAERCGFGVVTDKWNRTGWIWQKVQIEGSAIRAKTWPAHEKEPEEWAIEGEYEGNGERFGFKINSGDINLAYFAADMKDIPVEAPEAFLFAPVMRITQAKEIKLVLFSNQTSSSQKDLKIKVLSKGRSLGESSLAINIPAGSNEFPLILTTDKGNISESVPGVFLSAEPEEGELQVLIYDDKGKVLAERTVMVLPVHKMKERFARRTETLNALSNLLTEEKKGTGAYASVKVIHDAAKAHLDNAVSLFEAGDLDGSEMAFRFVDEALGELAGYKGAYLSQLSPDANLSVNHWDENDRRGVGAPKQGVIDACNMNCLLSFGKPETDAQSMVMGKDYTVTIPWYVEGGTPEKDYIFEARLVSPMGHRVVAKSEAGPEVPTSRWKPGQTYFQKVKFSVSPEDPWMGKGQPEQPAVLDEYHYLLVSLIDPETGGRLILGNVPGPQPERVGQSFSAGEFYISSVPVEIREVRFYNGEAGMKRADSFSVLNVGEKNLEAGALFSVTSESGQILYQDYKDINLTPGQPVELEFLWEPKWAGELELKVELVKDGITLTEVKSKADISLPGGQNVMVTKDNHVKKKGDKFYTPIMVDAGRKKTEVSVYAEGRLVGSAKGSGLIEVPSEPWFGYYDIVIKTGKYSYTKRLIATVVETNGMDIVVNGEPFLIKGVNVHGLDGRSPEKSESMMRIMRELGFNAWRGDYPPLWQMELAYELNSFYTVLGPFSCTSTGEIFARQAGPPMTTARELSRLIVERYKNSAGVLMWNSCNEIVGENIDFLNTLKPVYKEHDPYKRPVHYANLYGQDLYQGQDIMGVNYYFGASQSAKDRQPLIRRSIDIARSNSMPVMYNEFNSYAGAVHSTGVEAMYGMYEWGIEQGMCGGFQYMKGNSTSHPGIFDDGYNTHKIYNEAIIDVLADTEVTLKSADIKDGKVSLQVRNKRRFTLRQVKITLKASGTDCVPLTLADIKPQAKSEIAFHLPENLNGPACAIDGYIEFVTHYGFKSKVPVSLIVTGDTGE